MERLGAYRKRRDFDSTPEPRGRSRVPRRAGLLRFVVHKHRASHLHYDLRLEWDGVFLSWAVPKGPSLDPIEKRLARHVEDHPLEYGDFEGIIPRGQYGGGTVMVWDRGTFVPDSDDVAADLKAGKLSFELQGEKLRGTFAIVRMQGGRFDRNWLLIKRRDRFASKRDVTATAPCSVETGRNLAQIARDSGGDVPHAASGDPIAAGRCSPWKRRAATHQSNRRAARSRAS